METSWIDAKVVAFKNLGAEKAIAFDFDKLEMAHYVFNGYNKYTFPKTDPWRFGMIRYVKVGLGFFDFIRPNSSYELPELNSLITLERNIKKTVVKMDCVVLESHLQTKEELGELHFGDHFSYSTVCGRIVLMIVGMTVEEL